MSFNIPALDLEKSNTGTWTDYLNGVRLKIARYGNKQHAASMREALSAHKDDGDNTHLVDEVVESMATTILLDWTGLKDDKDAEIPYSVEVAKELLRAEEYVHFQGFVESFSKDQANYYIKETKDTTKNS